MYEARPLADLAEVNPRISLSKGIETPHVAMADVLPGERFVRSCSTKLFKGSGSKFITGDVLFARITPCLENGKIAQFESDSNEPAFGSTEFIVLRARDGIADPAFLYYLCLSQEVRGPAVLSMTGASGRQRASHKVLSCLEVPAPDLTTQQHVGSVLSVLDRLAENNRRRIELLEETARLLYWEWFVNFRYPGHEDVPLVDSELGPVPEGWGTTSLGQQACLTRSSITPGNYPSEMFDHFSLPAFDEKSDPEVESGESIKSNKYLVDGECVLWSKLNPRFPRVWWAAPFITERRSVASTEFLVLTENGGWRLPFIYSLLSSELFSLTMAARANGTSNSHQRVTPSDVMAYPLLDPDGSVQERFSDLISPFLQLKSELIIQNRSLTQTRDLLLPRLVSGDLDISGLDLDLEAVV